MTTQPRTTLLGLLALLGAISILPSRVQAQYTGLNLRGDMGLKSGSQPGPGIYAILPLYYRADYDGLRNRDGDNLLPGLNVDVKFFGVPAIAMTTKAKIAGATYGFSGVPQIYDLHTDPKEEYPSTLTPTRGLADR